MREYSQQKMKGRDILYRKIIAKTPLPHVESPDFIFYIVKKNS